MQHQLFMFFLTKQQVYEIEKVQRFATRWLPRTFIGLYPVLCKLEESMYDIENVF